MLAFVQSSYPPKQVPDLPGKLPVKGLPEAKRAMRQWERALTPSGLVGLAGAEHGQADLAAAPRQADRGGVVAFARDLVLSGPGQQCLQVGPVVYRVCFSTEPGSLTAHEINDAIGRNRASASAIRWSSSASYSSSVLPGGSGSALVHCPQTFRASSYSPARSCITHGLHRIC
jgi:hypothetical protein